MSWSVIDNISTLSNAPAAPISCNENRTRIHAILGGASFDYVITIDKVPKGPSHSPIVRKRKFVSREMWQVGHSEDMPQRRVAMAKITNNTCQSIKLSFLLCVGVQLI